MNRSDFIKLAATGVFIPPTFFIGCSKTKKKRSTKPKPKEVTDSTVEQFQKKSSSAERTFNSIAKLKNEGHNLAKKDSGEYNRVQLLGYYKPDDGGSGVFYWDADATEADNGGTIIKPEADKFTHSGRWKRVLKNDEVNVKAFGAKGDGSGVDDQPMIQKAIDYASENEIKKVFIPKGDYTIKLNDMPIGRDSSLDLKDNIHLKMDSDAILRLPEEETKTSYNVLRVSKSDNVKIEGGTIIGNKLTNTASKGEWGMGVGIYNAANVTMHKVLIKQQWGDGIYISGGNNITMTDTICDNNRRQGMSVISVNGLHVENCQFNNTKGTRPESGIDLEPNRSNDELKNIYFKNIKCVNNNGHGMLFYLKNIATKNKPEITINISDAYVSHSGDSGILIKSFGAKGTGFINIENTVVRNNQNGAAYAIENWHKNAPSIRLKDIVAINPNVSGKGGTTWGSALIFRKSNVNYDNGNLHVDGFEVKSDKSAISHAPKDIYVAPDLWNCSFKNIKSKADKLYNISKLDLKKNNILDAALLKKLKR